MATTPVFQMLPNDNINEHNKHHNNGHHTDENHQQLDTVVTFENEKKSDIRKGEMAGMIAHEYAERSNGLWNRYERRNQKLIINDKCKDYVNNFTVHGLRKIFIGTKVEKIFWFAMVMFGVALSVYIIHGLIMKYLKYEVYTEIRAQVTDQNFFPSITFCEYTLLKNAYFAYCGVPQTTRHANYDVICQNRERNPRGEISEKDNLYWSNGVFNITKCSTWGGKYCANSNNFKTLRHFNHSCVTWNYKGDFHDIYSHTDIEFKFNAQQALEGRVPVIIAIPHDPEIHELDITKKIDVEQSKHYILRLDKTFIKRLPAPYPSNCTKLKTGDIFPGKYARRSCIESYNLIEMYKVCGDTLDYARSFIPNNILHDYRKNRTIREVLTCIHKYGAQETKRVGACAFPCEDLDIGTVATFHERKSGRFETSKEIKKESLYHVSVQYERVDTYKIMEEKRLYSWDQMACEIGGLIGLVIGASVISLVEIFAYVLLVISGKLL